MKKRTLTILIVVIVAVLAFSIYNFTGAGIIGFGDCSDTDNPNGNLSLAEQANVKGTASQENRVTTYTDSCVPGTTDELDEYYCRGNIAIKSDRIHCDIACEDGACVSAA